MEKTFIATNPRLPRKRRRRLRMRDTLSKTRELRRWENQFSTSCLQLAEEQFRREYFPEKAQTHHVFNPLARVIIDQRTLQIDFVILENSEKGENRFCAQSSTTPSMNSYQFQMQFHASLSNRWEGMSTRGNFLRMWFPNEI